MFLKGLKLKDCFFKKMSENGLKSKGNSAFKMVVEQIKSVVFLKLFGVQIRQFL